ncbi:MAG TPA: DUF885 domain-containing protein [Candidatus Saccharimonadales bacterium]|nr:DUF885 domain-containing protein [Candidatus Saccharimonadales bacterium]
MHNRLTEIATPPLPNHAFESPITNPTLRLAANAISLTLQEQVPILAHEIGGSQEFLDYASTVLDRHPIDPYARADLDSTYKCSLEVLDHLSGNFYSGEWQIKERMRTELSFQRDILNNVTAYRRTVDQTPGAPAWGFLKDSTGTGRFSFDTLESIERSRERFKAWQAWVDTSIECMEEGIAYGDTQTAVVTAAALDKFDQLLQDPGVVDRFLQPLRKAGLRISSGTIEAYEAEVREQVLPAYQKLRDYLAQRYIQNCRDNSRLGMWALPGDQYSHLLAYFAYDPGFTVQRAADFAEAQWEKALEGLEEVKEALGFSDIAACIDYIMHDEVFHTFTSIQDVHDEYSRLNEQVRSRLGRIFNDPVVDPLKIYVHSATAAESSFATYKLPSRDGTVPGIFTDYVVDPRKESNNNLRRLIWHEGPPGHGVHLPWQQRAEHLPDLLRYSPMVHCYIEGWAMYAEGLAADLGIPESLEQYARRLITVLNVTRALLLDIGVNHKGWSMATAQAKQREMYGRDPGEILRILAWPGQSLLYPFGLERFNAMRQKAEIELGDAFRVQDFHDVLLRNGSLSFDYAWFDVAGWIMTQRKRAGGR